MKNYFTIHAKIKKFFEVLESFQYFCVTKSSFDLAICIWCRTLYLKYVQIHICSQVIQKLAITKKNLVFFSIIQLLNRYEKIEVLWKRLWWDWSMCACFLKRHLPESVTSFQTAFKTANNVLYLKWKMLKGFTSQKQKRSDVKKRMRSTRKGKKTEKWLITLCFKSAKKRLYFCYESLVLQNINPQNFEKD